MAPEARLPPQRILPDGGVELLFHLGTPNRRLTAGTAEAEPLALLAGALRQPVVVQPAAGARVFGVRLRPGGAHRFFAPAARALCDVFVPLAEVAPGPLPERLLGAASEADQAALVTDDLLDRARRLDRSDRLVDHAVATIRRRRGTIRIAELAATLGTSSRDLERRFERWVGLPPKVLCRVVRLEHAARGLLAGDGDADLPFSDQPHLIRELRDLGGTTPRRLVTEPHLLTALFLG